jgi:hypothetical protein
MILLPTTRVRKSYYLFSGHLFYIMGGFRCWRHEDRHFIETKPWIGILQMPTLDIFYLMLQTNPNNVRDGENIRLHPLTANGEMGPGLDSPVAGMPGMRFCWFCTLWAMTRLSQVNSMLPPRCCSGTRRSIWRLHESSFFLCCRIIKKLTITDMLSLKFQDNMSRN